MPSYLFYDIETTGLNPAFDQILQFAAIRTDGELRETARHTLTVRLRPDVIPSPGALLTHGIGVEASLRGTCEFEAVARIHQWLNAPDTISIGYNSLGFDDEFLRFAFFRNLLPPYTHQYENGCRRVDLYPMVIVCRLYRPELLTWPETDGRLSLRLEHLGAANRLSAGPAHDALVDAGTTLALARRLRPHRRMWDYLDGCFDKATDLARMENIPVAFRTPWEEHRKALMIDGRFGTALSFQAPVLSIGRSIPYGNQTLWLRLDTAELRQTTAETVSETTRVVRKKPGEPGLVLPPGGRHWKGLAADRRSLAEDNLAWLRSRPELFQQIAIHHQEYRYPRIPDLDADAALYAFGFPSPEERTWCRRFHDATPEERRRLASLFPEGTLRELAARILVRNYPDVLPEGEDDGPDRLTARVRPVAGEKAMRDFRGRERRTPAAALAEIERILREEDPGPGGREVLAGLKAYLRRRFET